MKAKLLRDAGEITEGTEVEVASRRRNERRAVRQGPGRTEHHRRAGLRGDRRRRTRGEGRHARPQAVAVAGTRPRDAGDLTRAVDPARPPFAPALLPHRAADRLRLEKARCPCRRRIGACRVRRGSPSPGLAQALCLDLSWTEPARRLLFLTGRGLREHAVDGSKALRESRSRSSVAPRC